MMYSEQINKKENGVQAKTVALARMLQKNLNYRLDGLIFRAVSNMATFNSEMPHADNVISIVQIDSTEVHIYKGDQRIVLGEDPIYGNHIILINYIDP